MLRLTKFERKIALDDVKKFHVKATIVLFLDSSPFKLAKVNDGISE